MPAPYNRRDWQQKTDRAVNRVSRGARQGGFAGARPVGGNPVAAGSAADRFGGVYVRASAIDKWDDIDDDTRGSFNLTHPAIDDTWNLTLNTITQVNGVDYSIDGRILTISDPTVLFAGAADDVAAGDDPWTLQVQYDYLEGVADNPLIVTVDYRSTGWRYLEVTSADATDRSSPTYDDSAWSVGQGAFGHNASGLTTIHTTWGTSGGIDDLWLRRTIPAGSDFHIDFDYLDDKAEVYWNGTFVDEVLGVGAASLDIPNSAVVPGAQLLAVRAVDQATTRAAIDMKVSGRMS